MEIFEMVAWSLGLSWQSLKCTVACMVRRVDVILNTCVQVSSETNRSSRNVNDKGSNSSSVWSTDLNLGCLSSVYRDSFVGSVKKAYNSLIVWVFKGLLVQPPTMRTNIFSCYWVAQSPIQPQLECFQRWDISTSLGNPFLYEKQGEFKTYFWAT